MSERTMGGLAAARGRGRTGGRKPRLGPRQIRLVRQMYGETDPDGKCHCTVGQIAALSSISSAVRPAPCSCLRTGPAALTLSSRAGSDR